MGKGRSNRLTVDSFILCDSEVLFHDRHRPNREMAIGITIPTALCIPRFRAGLREFPHAYVQFTSPQWGDISRPLLQVISTGQFSRKPNVTGTTVVGIPELNA